MRGCGLSADAVVGETKVRMKVSRVRRVRLVVVRKVRWEGEREREERREVVEGVEMKVSDPSSSSFDSAGAVDRCRASISANASLSSFGISSPSMEPVVVPGAEGCATDEDARCARSPSSSSMRPDMRDCRWVSASACRGNTSSVDEKGSENNAAGMLVSGGAGAVRFESLGWSADVNLEVCVGEALY